MRRITILSVKLVVNKCSNCCTYLISTLNMYNSFQTQNDKSDLPITQSGLFTALDSKGSGFYFGGTHLTKIPNKATFVQFIEHNKFFQKLLISVICKIELFFTSLFIRICCNTLHHLDSENCACYFECDQ